MFNLFKLPIYNYSPKQIGEKYLLARSKRVAELVAYGNEEDSSIDFFNSRHIKQSDPDNYIIGYLYVDFRNGCFEYRLGVCEKSNSSKPYKMPLFTTTKHYMQVNHVNGVYDCPDGMCNNEIASMIKNTVDMICENDIPNLYCDRVSFYVINRNLDYISLLDDINAER
ncbi:MAG: hypothetical protein NC184_05295 [Roseburia sp.]|nr:hypothetical protein [Roseburia sp.]